MVLDHTKGEYTMTTTAQQWGNSLGVRIPQKIAQQHNVVKGAELEVVSSKDGILFKPVKKKPTLEELLSQCTGENPHEEFFSEPMGREEI